MIVVLRSALVAPMLTLPVALQPLLVTAMLKVTFPVDPDVNVIEGVFAPAVIVPPAIDQE